LTLGRADPAPPGSDFHAFAEHFGFPLKPRLRLFSALYRTFCFPQVLVATISPFYSLKTKLLIFSVLFLTFVPVRLAERGIFLNDINTVSLVRIFRQKVSGGVRQRKARLYSSYFFSLYKRDK
jgi:hypothetical protein